MIGAIDDLQFGIHLIHNDDLVATYYTDVPLNDGGWYNITLVLSPASIFAFIQGPNTICSPSCLISAIYPLDFDLSNPDTLTFGNIVPILNLSSTLQDHFPHPNGINGCIRDLTIESTQRDFTSGYLEGYPVGTGCPRDQYCLPDPCDNGGMCVASWEGYSCLCEPEFEGRNCSEGKL